MNLELLRQIIQEESPFRLEIGTVVSTDPRGTRSLSVRLSGGTVCNRAHACVTGLAVGDEVLVLRTKDKDRIVVVGKILNEYESSLSQAGILAPPANLAATPVPAAISVRWDTRPGEDLCWQIQHNASAAEDGNQVAVLVTRGSYYLHWVVDASGDMAAAVTRYFRVRAVRWISDNNVMYSGWSAWIGATNGGYNLRGIRELEFAPTTELTIASGVITRTQVYHRVDTEGNAASDDLDTIGGGTTGDLLIIRPEHDARTVVVRHNVGNIWLQGKTNIPLDDIDDHLILVYTSSGKWCDASPSGVGTGGNTILRVNASGAQMAEYPVTDAGFRAALAAAAQYDTVLLPGQTLTLADIVTIPNRVRVKGVGCGAALNHSTQITWSFWLTPGAFLTLGVGAVLEDVEVMWETMGYGGAQLVLVDMPNGNAEIHNCKISLAASTPLDSSATALHMHGTDIVVDLCTIELYGLGSPLADTAVFQESGYLFRSYIYSGLETALRTAGGYAIDCRVFALPGYGIRATAGTPVVIGGYHYGQAGDFQVDAGATLSVYGCQYSTTGGDGTLVHLPGDRAGKWRDEIITGTWTFGKELVLPEQAGAPGGAANTGKLYTRDDGAGNTELYYADEAGNETKLTPIGGGGGASAFTDLTDTPANYVDDALKLVRVNAGENALEFVDPADVIGEQVESFLDLDDTPADYTDQAGLGVAVNDTEDGLEFVDVTTQAEMDAHAGNADAHHAQTHAAAHRPGQGDALDQVPDHDHTGDAGDGADLAHYLLVDGTRAMSGNLALGGNSVTGGGDYYADGESGTNGLNQKLERFFGLDRLRASGAGCYRYNYWRPPSVGEEWYHTLNEEFEADIGGLAYSEGSAGSNYTVSGSLLRVAVAYDAAAGNRWCKLQKAVTAWGSGDQFFVRMFWMHHLRDQSFTPLTFRISADAAGAPDVNNYVEAEFMSVAGGQSPTLQWRGNTCSGGAVSNGTTFTVYTEVPMDFVMRIRESTAAPQWRYVAAAPVTLGMPPQYKYSIMSSVADAARWTPAWAEVWCRSSAGGGHGHYIDFVRFGTSGGFDGPA